MIVKVFQKNKNGKIELTKEELETLLNEVYWDGYRANSTWSWSTPRITTGNLITTDTPIADSCKITIGDGIKYEI